MEHRVSLCGEAPDAAPLAAFAGVGLLRGEFLFRRRGQHPRVPAAREALARYLDAVCAAFTPRPVWYRTCDLWSDEARTLEGNDLDAEEQNPLVGLRGVRRSLASPAAFALELEAVAAVARRWPGLHVLFPFVQDAAELAQCAQALESVGWPNRFGAMLEIPSAILDAPAMVEAGASNLLIGLNDLSCLMLGQARRSGEVAPHPAVWWAVERAAGSLPAGIEWGVGGRLSPAVLAGARRRGATYVTAHYDALPELFGAAPEGLPDLGLEREIKAQTRAAKARGGTLPR